MSERLRVLIDNLQKELSEAPGDVPMTEPDVEVSFEIHSTWRDFAFNLYAQLADSKLAGEYVGNGYAYLINITPYAASTIQLKWWGPKKHPRLVEIKRAIRDFINRSREVFWEDIKASEIRRQLQLMKNQGLEKHKEIIRKFFEFYNDKLPYSVLKNISIDSFDYDPETNTLTLNISSDYAGHIIGKQGAKVKAFQEATGIKLRIVTPEAET